MRRESPSKFFIFNIWIKKLGNIKFSRHMAPYPTNLVTTSRYDQWRYGSFQTEFLRQNIFYLDISYIEMTVSIFWFENRQNIFDYRIISKWYHMKHISIYILMICIICNICWFETNSDKDGEDRLSEHRINKILRWESF